jgi:hypothetical protein
VTGECSSDDATSEYRETNGPTTVLPEIHTTARSVVTRTSGRETDEATPVFQATEHSSPQTRANTDTDERTLRSTTMSILTAPSLLTDKAVETQIAKEVRNSSLASVTPLLDHQTKGHGSGYDSTDTDMEVSQEAQEPQTIRLEDSGRQTEDPGTTETQNASQNVPPARRPVIVVSDGLQSERMDEDENEGTASGVSTLVSSATVAGGVALTLIVMATVTTMLVSRRRNRAKMAVAENDMASLRDQQQPTSAPHAYNYTQDVTTLPRELYAHA